MLTPDRKAQMDAVLGKTRTTTILTPERRAQMDSVLKGTTQPKAPTIQGFGENIVKSGVKTIEDTINAGVNVFNSDPKKNTINNLGKLMVGTAEATQGTPLNPVYGAVKNFIPQSYRDEGTQAFNATKDFYAKRYGVDKAMKFDIPGAVGAVGDTLYNDPVGVAMDVSTVAGGVGLAGNTSKVGKIANTISKFTDPVSLATGGVTKVLSKTGGKTQKIAGEFSDILAEKQIRANPSQILKFEEKTGKPLSTFVKQNNYFGGAKNASKKVASDIAENQMLYNDMARTGSSIPKEMYTQAIRQRADAIMKSNLSPDARAIAEKLYKEADYIDSLDDLNLTDTLLTDTKTGSYSKAGNKAIMDALTENFNKELAQAGNSVLETINPQIIETGRTLRDLRSFQDIVKKQRNLGTGSQLINAFKAPASVGTMGGVLGSVVPGIGTMTGIGLGAGGALLLNSPKFQSQLAKILEKTTKARIPNKVKTFTKGITKGSYTFSKFASRQKGEE